MSLQGLTEYALIEKYSKKIHVLRQGSTRIGRLPINNIQITSSMCSKFHSTITVRENMIFYHDFSNNGSNVMRKEKFLKIAK